MFGTPKKQPFIKMAQLSTLVAEGVEITGNLVFAGGMRIDGRIEGVIGYADRLRTESPAIVRALPTPYAPATVAELGARGGWDASAAALYEVLVGAASATVNGTP